MDIANAQLQLVNRLGAIADTLPTEAGKPLIRKSDPNETPILYFTFSSTTRSEQQLSDYVSHFVEPEFQGITGVGDIVTWGSNPYAIKVHIDPYKLAANKLTVQDVINTLKQQNTHVAAGEIDLNGLSIPVAVNDKLHSLEQFESLLIKNGTYLRDVAIIKHGSTISNHEFRVNGEAALSLGIVPQANSNPLQVAKDAEKIFARINSQIAKDIHGEVFFNQGTFIQSSINHVYETLIAAIVLVGLVVWLFLRKLRIALIPIITIPICLITTFAGIYILGYTINTITLLAMVLGIGLVVDDAIVVVENVTRYRESGANTWLAALKGSQEIVFPIIGMTVTLAAVYLPINFIEGITGKFFSEFALTLAFSVLVSGFVAITLTPMMCAHLITIVPTANSLSRLQKGLNN